MDTYVYNYDGMAGLEDDDNWRTRGQKGTNDETKVSSFVPQVCLFLFVVFY